MNCFANHFANKPFNLKMQVLGRSIFRRFRDDVRENVGNGWFANISQIESADKISKQLAQQSLCGLFHELGSLRKISAKLGLLSFSGSWISMRVFGMTLEAEHYSTVSRVPFLNCASARPPPPAPPRFTTNIQTYCFFHFA